MAKKKFYVVWKGRKTGIFETWDECKIQIEDFKGSLYKSFNTFEEAKTAFNSKPHESLSLTEKTPPDKNSTPIKNAICVDGAFDTKNKVAEYQGIHLETKKTLFRQGPFEKAGINLVEFLAIVHALAYCYKNDLDLPIYSDSTTAIAWVRNKKIKTDVERSSENKEVFELIDRALIWLHQHKYTNKILKWETEFWGENPADFGRK